MNNIYQKILAVQKATDSVPKRGFNAFHKYSYATEADILTVKEALNAHGLIVLPTTLGEETGFKPDGKSWATITLLFRVVDTESGEIVESRFTGYAEDNNDKAIYKATTGANKYFYLKFFGIATEDDPEREDEQPKPASKPAARATSKATQAKVQPKLESLEIQKAKTQALSIANKILALQKQHHLSNEEVLKFGDIKSIKDLAEEGDYTTLYDAFNRLLKYCESLTPQE